MGDFDGPRYGIPHEEFVRRKARERRRDRYFKVLDLGDPLPMWTAPLLFVGSVLLLAPLDLLVLHSVADALRASLFMGVVLLLSLGGAIVWGAVGAARARRHGRAGPAPLDASDGQDGPYLRLILLCGGIPVPIFFAYELLRHASIALAVTRSVSYPLIVAGTFGLVHSYLWVRTRRLRRPSRER